VSSAIRARCVWKIVADDSPLAASISEFFSSLLDDTRRGLDQLLLSYRTNYIHDNQMGKYAF
jgi:hypothetical protein